MMSKISLHQLNNFDNAKFVSVLLGVYEHSPWIVNEAANHRLFNSIDELQDTCISLIDNASDDTKLSLIRAHPDLAAKLEHLSKLTKFSQQEQSDAGFNSLPIDAIKQLRAGLISYRQRFGHPFILCLAEHSAVDILPILKIRLQSDSNDERASCIFQITRIGWHRLCSIIIS